MEQLYVTYLVDATDDTVDPLYLYIPHGEGTIKTTSNCFEAISKGVAPHLHNTGHSNSIFTQHFADDALETLFEEIGKVFSITSPMFLKKASAYVMIDKDGKPRNPVIVREVSSTRFAFAFPFAEHPAEQDPVDPPPADDAGDAEPGVEEEPNAAGE